MEERRAKRARKTSQKPVKNDDDSPSQSEEESEFEVAGGDASEDDEPLEVIDVEEELGNDSMDAKPDDASQEEEKETKKTKPMKKTQRATQKPRKKATTNNKKKGKEEVVGSDNGEEEQEALPKNGVKRKREEGTKAKGKDFRQTVPAAVSRRRRTAIDDKGKEIPTLGNLGGLAGDVFVMRRPGEYQGLAIKLLESCPPLLTDRRVVKAMELVQEGQFQGAAKALWLEDTSGDDLISLVHAVVAKWLREIGHPIPGEYADHVNKTLPDRYVHRVKRQYAQALECSFEIVAIGSNDTGAVVPESWLQRRFANAKACHAEMDKLPWREGKPPVTYCLTPGLVKEEGNAWRSDLGELHKQPSPGYVAMHVKGKVLLSRPKNDKPVWAAWRKEHLDGLKPEDGVVWRVWVSRGVRVLVVVDLKSDEERSLVREPVSRWISTLQKAVRRGRGNFDLVGELVERLGQSRAYCLPEHQFLKVSAFRQLTWRLLIICIEDVCPYASSSAVCGMVELMVLATVCTADPEFVLGDSILTRLATTARGLVCQDERQWDFRQGQSLGKHKQVTQGQAFNKLWTDDGEDEQTKIANALSAALGYMPMMSGDRSMLELSAKLLHKKLAGTKDLKPLSIFEKNPSDDGVAGETLLAGIDHHCFPNLILHIQASLPPGTLSTQAISRYVWDNISGLNIRQHKGMSPKDERYLQHIDAVKRWYVQTKADSPDQEKKGSVIARLVKTLAPAKSLVSPLDEGKAEAGASVVSAGGKVDEETGRTAFLLLFGHAVAIPSSRKYPRMEVWIGGTKEDPFVVKAVHGGKKQEMRSVHDEEQCKYAVSQYMEKMRRESRLVSPPQTRIFEWVWDSKQQAARKKVRISVSGDKFIADGIETTLLDGSPFVRSFGTVSTSSKTPENLRGIVRKMVGGSRWEVNLFCREQKNGLKQCYDWASLIKENALPLSTWKSLYTQIHRPTVEIGPVDRGGSKLQRAVSYSDEGYQWRLMNLFAFLYPRVVTPLSTWRFSVNQGCPEFQHLASEVKSILDKQLATVFSGKAKDTPKVTRDLWDHQQQSRRRMVDGFVKFGKRGFGDASHVGAGKTLISLSVMSDLFAHRNKSSGAFLVLVPNLQLVKTWRDEIAKHTKGFHVVVQNANGTLTPPSVYPNTILVTSMGRCRDHPLTFPWVLVVVDECLSVQNKEALQTEEAWRQCLTSQFGVCMMSATFFRSRFDKLYYMLQMLHAHFPAEKEYLHLLLSEHIVCHLQQDNPRVWLSNTHKFSLSKEKRQAYVKIQQSAASDTKELYLRLFKFIQENVNYVDLFMKRLKELPQDRKCLIYAKSKEEARSISEKQNNIGLYPNISCRHVVVSYTAGTYGLNDLVAFDTILTRPPEPDKLPQMKGRLDRPGQKKTTLHLEMILVEDTIEEALLFRLEMASYFYRKYIMPIAEFYEHAVKSGLCVIDD